MQMIHDDTTAVSFDTSLGRVVARVTGEGPIAVLWHGMFVDGRSWDPVIPRLRQRRRLVVLDAPGYGASDALERLSTIEECAEVAVQIVDQLPGTGPVDWLGAAWGGHVGMAAAALFPGSLRSLVAISSPVEPIDRFFRLKLIIASGALARLGPIAHLRHAVHGAQLTKANQHNADMTAIIDDAMTGVEPEALARTVTSFIINRTDATHRLPRIHVPALLVAGDDRGEWSPEIMAEAADRIPNARTAVVNGARTLVQVEQPEATANAVEAFWDSL
ncbi:alpha/beta fold hydrolase [Agromyces sp. CCNWLW203]|uniref:alpha/beta fold hydrolase n=1 Tax=Agromyces sp. CCNWLW203 TaxID=3112842 RepID=UPI002F9689ED